MDKLLIFGAAVGWRGDKVQGRSGEVGDGGDKSPRCVSHQQQKYLIPPKLQDCRLSRFLPFIPSRLELDLKYPAGAPPLLAFILPALDPFLVPVIVFLNLRLDPAFFILGNLSASRSLFHIHELRKPDIGLGVEDYLNQRPRPQQAVITLSTKQDNNNEESLVVCNTWLSPFPSLLGGRSAVSETLTSNHPRQPLTYRLATSYS